MSDFPLEFSPSLGALAKALAAAQGELKDAVKDAVNPHFKSKFATLSSVRSAITPTFTKYGLAVTQLNEPHGDAGVCVVTLLMHESGEWIRSRLYVPVSKKDAQGFGSALSYARRYALAMIANIASDEDDDANEAVSSPKREMYESAPKREVDKREVVKDTDQAANDSGPDIEPLLAGIKSAKDMDEMAKALLPCARVREKLTKAQRDLLNAARENRIRELEAQAS